MRVLAAVSGGVDSAVAMARAVEAGHDVTAVHLALARDPQRNRTGSRGCCSLPARRRSRITSVPRRSRRRPRRCIRTCWPPGAMRF